jgi:hypothetical protein
MYGLNPATMVLMLMMAKAATSAMMVRASL